MPIDELDWEFDADTLREIVRIPEQLKAVRTELTQELDGIDEDAEPARVALLAGQRAVLSRVLDELDLALGDGQRAVAAAEHSGDPQTVAVARARLAHVYQYRGEFQDANELFKQALAAAEEHDFPASTRASLHQHAGKNLYEQRQYAAAANHFAEAAHLRADADPKLLASSQLALEAARSRVANG